MKIKQLLITILIAFSLMPIIIVTLIFLLQFDKQANDLIMDKIADTTTVQAENLNSFFTGRATDLSFTSHLESVSKLLAEANNSSAQTENLELNRQKVNRILKSHTKGELYIRGMFLMNSEGTIIASSNKEMIGRASHVSDQISSVESRNVVISDIHPQDDMYKGFRHLIMAIPIYDDKNNYIGCLKQVLDMSYFEQIVGKSNFFETGSLAILDNEGNIAASGSDHKFEKDIEAMKMSGNMAGGFVEYTVDSKRKLAYYTTISNSGWTIISTVDWHEFRMPVMDSIITMVTIICLMTILIILIYFMIVKHISSPMQALIHCIHKFRNGHLYARLPNKKSGINELDEIAVAFNELVDSVEKNTNELKQSNHDEKQYRSALESVCQFVFKVNITEDKFISGNEQCAYLNEMHGTVIFSTMVNLFANSAIHPDDKEAVNSVLSLENIKHAFANNKSQVYIEFRRIEHNGDYVWTSCTLVPLYDEINKRILAIGYTRNIDDQKKKELEAISKSQQDSLTGLYNKGTTKNLIEDYIDFSRSNGNKHAMFILDVDNFKAVNDNLGHLLGDEVLKAVADQLRQIFRITDIIGRIGGDEFIVFMKDIPSIQFVVEIADACIDVLRRTFLDQTQMIKITSSVGISVYPDHGETYSELFKKADIALYETKRHGKDNYFIYDHKFNSEI